MPKKPPFSYKLSQRPGRFKLYERSQGQKLQIANVIAKQGLTEVLAKRLTERLNSEWRIRVVPAFDPEELFRGRVLSEARELLLDRDEDINASPYNDAVVDLVANVLGDVDEIISGLEGARTEYEQMIRDSNATGSNHHPLLKVKLEEASDLALRLETLMGGISDIDTEGVTDGMRTDIEGLTFGIQQLIEGEDYDSDPTHEKLLQEVRRGKTENNEDPDEEDPTGGPLPEGEYFND